MKENLEIIKINEVEKIIDDAAKKSNIDFDGTIVTVNKIIYNMINEDIFICEDIFNKYYEAILRDIGILARNEKEDWNDIKISGIVARYCTKMIIEQVQLDNQNKMPSRSMTEIESIRFNTNFIMHYNEISIKNIYPTVDKIISILGVEENKSTRIIGDNKIITSIEIDNDTNVIYLCHNKAIVLALKIEETSTILSKLKIGIEDEFSSYLNRLFNNLIMYDKK